MKRESVRSVDEHYADKMDLDLFRLIRRVEGRAAAADTNPRSRAKWHRVTSELRLARFQLRMLMHPEDLKATR